VENSQARSSSEVQEYCVSHQKANSVSKSQTKIIMENNPESLKYTIGQRICWKDSNGVLLEGTVANVSFHGVEVVSGRVGYEVKFEDIIKKNS